MIVEIGGTVGDIESLPFLEAIRQFRHEVGRDNAIFIHLTLVPYIAAAGELKTKPTQHSVRELMQIGIQPDILICRTRAPDLRRHQAQDRALLQRGIRLRHREPRRAARSTRSRCASTSRASTQRCARVSASRPAPDLPPLEQMTERDPRSRTSGCASRSSASTPTRRQLQERAGSAHPRRHRQRRRRRHPVDVERGSPIGGAPAELLATFDGLLVPGGFGVRGVEGMVEAIR